MSSRAKKEVYLDHAAATPLSPTVAAAMQPYWGTLYANPSSIHEAGVGVRQAIENARATCAAVLGCTSQEILFTSGGTEANNLAIRGIVEAARQVIPQPHLVVSCVEHPSVLEVARYLETTGVSVTYLPVHAEGTVSLHALKQALRKETVLVSIMYANNEIGTIQPIKEISQILRRFKKEFPTTYNLQPTTYPFFHSDACQAAGALPLNIASLGVDLMTCNGSKIYGPKGIGMLYKRAGASMTKQLYGGEQEANLRAGTEFVPGIVGIAAALQEADTLRTAEASRLLELSQFCIEEIKGRFGETCVLNGSSTDRLPNNINFSFPGIEGERLVLELDVHGIAVSSGSSCRTKDEVSHVVYALDHTTARAKGALRMSLGRATSKDDLDYVLSCLFALVPRLREEI